MLRFTKTELKKCKKERARCKKSYSDWKPDQYNCGPLKFIWGINSKGVEVDNFYELNDLQIVYNRDTKKYMLDLDTTVSKDTGVVSHLEELLNIFTKYVADKIENIDPLNLSLYWNGELFQADSITELYYKFKLFVKGYSNI